jgi:hypothetical protein
MLTAEPDTPFRRYRLKRVGIEVWAKRMPEAFELKMKLGRVDQRKAGAKQVVDFVQLLKGDAGDYLVIDADTGDKSVHHGPSFERIYEAVSDTS